MNDSYGNFNRQQRQCKHCDEVRYQRMAERNYERKMAWATFWVACVAIFLISIVIVAQWRMHK